MFRLFLLVTLSMTAMSLSGCPYTCHSGRYCAKGCQRYYLPRMVNAHTVKVLLTFYGCRKHCWRCCANSVKHDASIEQRVKGPSKFGLPSIF